MSTATRADVVAEMASRFAADTKNHVMTVKHDDGLYRHVRFASPESSFYWFDLVTWPGHLAFVGDGDGYVFARDTDMFEFFRGRVGALNPGYWAEKITDGRERTRTYAMHLFRKQVDAAVKEAAGDYPDLAKAVDDALENDYNYEYEETAKEFLSDFLYTDESQYEAMAELKAKYHELLGADTPELRAARAEYQRAEDATTFRFEGWEEWDLTDYDWWYLWACHAIQWGIGQYEAPRVAAEAAA